MDAHIDESHQVWDGHVKVWRVRLVYADGSETWREVANHGDSIAVLPYDAERRVALTVSLTRAPALFLGAPALAQEACAGMIDKGETPEATARREAMEEMGVRLTELEWVARTWPSPGVHGERASLYLAPYAAADRIGQGGGAEGEHEHICVHERGLADLAADADEGRIVDLSLLTLVQTARLRRPDLFSG